MAPKIAIGIDDFRQLREGGFEYVDKTAFVRAVIDLGAIALLVPRPRRFGKSLNLSTLRWFFEKRDEDLTPLFEGLEVFAAGPEYRAHFQKHPVIYMSLKGAKAPTWKECWQVIQRKIIEMLAVHRSLLTGAASDDIELRWYRQALDGEADLAGYQSALLLLSSLLQRAHGVPVVILIDEYDEPIHAAHANGYLPQALDFFRAFLTEGLKGNTHLYKAVLTGILRISKENVFSGLNNLAVYSLLRPEMNGCFGFTEAEVTGLLERHGSLAQMAAVRRWYNGYLFGGTQVYNPWSILNFVASEDKALRNYWAGTSANDLAARAIRRHGVTIEPDFEVLMAGGSIEKPLDESVALADLDHRATALWSLLVMTGYLKAEPPRVAEDEELVYRLSIPNREVREVYKTTFKDWLLQAVGGSEGAVERLATALLSGDAAGLEELLQRFVEGLSYHDTAPKESLEPEQVYQAFVIGLLATLERSHLVRSNRESGDGRPDVQIVPRTAGQPGALLELKVVRKGRTTAQKALADALAQLGDKRYDADLRAAGASPIHAFAVAFDGKRVWVKSAGVASPARIAPAKKKAARKSR